MRLPLFIAAALLAASTASYAQADDKAPRRQPRDFCAQAKDPKACEERVARARDMHAKARKACEGRPDGERRDCMRRELCAQTEDPAKCEARAKEALAKREKAREACKDKQGDERRACMREQLGRKPSSS